MSFRKVDIPYQYEKYCVHLRLTQRSIDDIFTNAFFICISAFLLEHSRFAGQQGREAISLTPLYHFHPLHRHLDITQVITVESSLLHIAAGLKSGTYGFRAQVANH